MNRSDRSRSRSFWPLTGRFQMLRRISVVQIQRRQHCPRLRRFFKCVNPCNMSEIHYKAGSYPEWKI